MDANRTRYHLLLGRDDWLRCRETLHRRMSGAELRDCLNPSPPGVHACDFAWDEEHQELTLRPSVLLFVSRGRDEKPKIENRRGAASDRYGNLYWIDDEQSGIRVFSAGCREESLFWSSKECPTCPPSAALGAFRPEPKPVPVPCGLRGLAVTDNHYLVVGVLKPAGLLVFDLHAGGPPERLLWPEAIPFAPFDMAARPGGGVWILDREQRRYWGLDRNFNVIGQAESSLSTARTDTFQPEGGELRSSPAGTSPAGFDLEDASLINAARPIAIEALPDGTVLILDADAPPGFSRIHRYRLGQRIGEPASLEVVRSILEDTDRQKAFLVGHDFAFVPAHKGEDGKGVEARLYLVGADGNQSFALRFADETEQWRLEPVAEFLPMRRFTGRGLVRMAHRLFYDAVNRWVPLIRQDQPRYEVQATLATPVFDGREPDCVWHRLLLDACIPPETQVRVWSRAANDLDDIKGNRVGWAGEPPLYRRGDGLELPFAPKPKSPETGTHELLFQNAHGRFLQLRLELTGNHRASPHLRALRAYYPRFSYLKHYLPAVYREDKDSASFLERFLANPEGILTATEDRVAAVQALFDPRSAPSEALNWLASWFGVAFDPQWDDERRRLFIRHAMAFFQYRGTVRGLEMALRLVFDEVPDEKIFTEYPARCYCADRYRIVERFRTRPAPPVTPGETKPEKRCRGKADEPPWRPEDGAQELHRRFASFFGAEKAVPAVRFSLAPPDNERGRWTWFAKATLGFVPEDNPEERAGWQEFLQSRYGGDTGKLNEFRRRYGRFPGAETGGSAASVSLPPLAEYRERWTQFAQVTLGFVPDDNPDERAGWQAFLRTRYDGELVKLNDAHASQWQGFDEPILPTDLPAAGARRDDWRNYMTAPAPATLAGNRRRRWQAFLTRRYVRIDTLNADWQTRWDAFGSIPLPGELPADAEALRDWFDFETLVMPTARAAHQFSVLLPVTSLERTDSERRQRTLRLARRVVELEKPAHTRHEVNFYWALFRVGEARLGLDTLLVEDTRALLLAPMILDEGFLASSYLAPTHPFDVADRRVVGRDRI